MVLSIVSLRMMFVPGTTLSKGLSQLSPYVRDSAGQDSGVRDQGSWSDVRGQESGVRGRDSQGTGDRG